jgi:uncharacterized protein (TIRG00374 family)
MHTSSRRGAVLRQGLGYAIAAACLVWVFHDVGFRDLATHAATIAWGWVAVAVACDVLSYACQGYRWSRLLRPAGEIPALRATQAIYVGLLTNEIIPMRLGELVRMYLVSRWIKIDFVSVLPSYMVERLIDSVWLAVAVGLAALFVPLPHEVIVGEEILGAVILALTAAFAIAVVRRGRFAGPEAGGEPAANRRPVKGLSRLIGRMALGLHQIGFSRGLLLAAVGSLGILVFQALAFWLIMVAMSLPLSIWQGAAVFLIVHLGTALPNAPSNVGSYQFFAVVGLAIFGVEKPVAASFSIVVFLLLTIPLWIIGLAALRRTGMSLSTLRSEVSRLGKVRKAAA